MMSYTIDNSQLTGIRATTPFTFVYIVDKS